MVDDDSVVEVDVFDGESLDDIECPMCGRDYDEHDWELGHGCPRCGVGYEHCPTPDCDGSVCTYF